MRVGVIADFMTVGHRFFPAFQPFVYVASGSNQFGRRDVELGESQNGRTQILKGISPGERVAGDGSLFLQFANSLQH